MVTLFLPVLLECSAETILRIEKEREKFVQSLKYYNFKILLMTSVNQH